MNDPYSKFTPGQRIRDALSATRENALTDAARQPGPSFTDAGARGLPFAPIACLVRNDTGMDLDQYNIVAFDYPPDPTQAGVIFPPTANLPQFLAEHVFSGIVAVGYTGVPVCVLLEPAPAGAIVKAAVGGIVPCLVQLGSWPGFTVQVSANGSTDTLTAQASVGSSYNACGWLLYTQGAFTTDWGLVCLTQNLANYTAYNIGTGGPGGTFVSCIGAGFTGAANYPYLTGYPPVTGTFP